ncbi:VanZ family protein [Novipirellula herctigrandis]
MSTIPAYPIRETTMQSITKKTIWGFRLAIIVLAVYWLGMFIGTHLPSSVVRHGPRVNDKLMHVCCFAGLGWLLCYVTTSDRLLTRFSMIAVIGLFYAGLDEWSQGFVRGRSTDMMDFVADAVGLFSAIAVYAVCRMLYYRWKRSGIRTLDPVG